MSLFPSFRNCTKEYLRQHQVDATNTIHTRYQYNTRYHKCFTTLPENLLFATSDTSGRCFKSLEMGWRYQWTFSFTYLKEIENCITLDKYQTRPLIFASNDWIAVFQLGAKIKPKLNYTLFYKHHRYKHRQPEIWPKNKHYPGTS